MRCWVARVDAEPTGAWAAAPLRDAGGASVGWLAAWRQPGAPLPAALLADARAFAPDGAAACVSLAWAPEGFRLLYDDPAVQRARQIVLEGLPPAAVTCLGRDPSHLGGALTADRGADALRLLGGDPFARLLPTALLSVDAGIIGSPKPVASLVVERYGGQQWPADRFPELHGSSARERSADGTVPDGDSGENGGWRRETT